MLRLVALASLASVAVAQTGYGRFPCTNVNGDGTFSADDTKCTADALIAPGADTTNTEGNQGDGVTPINPVCFPQASTGAFFCGIAGAACTDSTNCDNGVCVGGTCQGGFTQACAGEDTNCSGFLYCNSADFIVLGETCGGPDAFCQDYTQGSLDFTDAENAAIFDQFCESQYCNAGTGNCDTRFALGEDCSTDPDFGCAGDLVCTNDVCAVPTVPSAVRARRSLSRRSSVCPASHTACTVSGTKSGFECIDVTSNLEQCGACSSAGGVDCTAIAGVEAVGCVAGQCEIWSCSEGFAWDAASSSCTASLLL